MSVGSIFIAMRISRKKKKKHPTSEYVIVKNGAVAVFEKCKIKNHRDENGEKLISRNVHLITGTSIYSINTYALW